MINDRQDSETGTRAVPLVAPGQVLTFILITSLFFSWGLAANMTDTLLAAFKRILSLTDFQTAFVQYAYFGGYFCFAIPASIVARRSGYKSGLLIGLALYMIGAFLFFPASISLRYDSFLFALYVLAAGLAFLETCANPFIYTLGPAATATRRLNLAQSFNPVGAIAGALIAKYFILSELHRASASERAVLGSEALRVIQQAELSAVMGPYVVVAALLAVAWIFLALKKMPTEALQSLDTPGSQGESLRVAFARLLANQRYVASVVTQFLYVGAQVGVWSFTIRYVMDRLGTVEDEAATYYTAGLVLFFISRFLCTWMMGWVRAETLLVVLAIAAAVLCAFSTLAAGFTGVTALVLVNGCMSLMFPTIYGIGLSSLDPRDTKLGGAGLIMAISGGAVVVGAQALLSDLAGDIGIAFWVPTLCFVSVAAFGWKARRSVHASSDLSLPLH